MGAMNAFVITDNQWYYTSKKEKYIWKLTLTNRQ